MKIRPGIEIASVTDVGCQRERNEDALVYWEPEADSEFAKRGRLAVVADGMGGYEGGQQASQIAISTVCEVYRQSDGNDPQSALRDGLRAAHEAILEYAAKHPEFYGMGTTCTAASIVGSQLYFAHIGDSRLYLVRGDSIRRLTRDHSYVARLVETGLLHPQEAEHHPQRHVLTAALGVGSEPATDVNVIGTELHKSDVLLLCTDGLWGVLADVEILTIASESKPEQACRKLLALAKERGGPDNITMQVMRITQNGVAS
jgi:protein phosphatase